MRRAELVIQTFSQFQNPEIARGQENYMKNQFRFFGISSPQRKELQKEWLLKSHLPTKPEAFSIAEALWQNPHRECHYFALDLLEKYSKNFEEKDIYFLEFLITNHSWWDTIDFISPKLVGNYFKKFPEKRDEIISKWLKSNHLWLMRSAILFQLKYKQHLDNELLSEIIKTLSTSKEFFINKAVGWILREYSKTNPKWVKNFIENHQLHSLSVKEGSKYL